MHKYLFAAYVLLTALIGASPSFAAATAQMNDDGRPTCGEPRGSHDCE